MGHSANPHQTVDGLSLEAKSSFRVFNTDVEIMLADWRYGSLLPRAETYFRSFEARFSRFRADSELSSFNNRPQAAEAVSPEMMALLSECLRLHRTTEGIFNPLIIDNLEAAGYGASFELLDGQTAPEGASKAAPPSLQCLDLDPERHGATLPLGLRLDFGGIGKGYAVDRAGSLLTGAGGFLIDAGGDIYAAGLSADGTPWRVEVASPLAPEESIGVVRLSDMAIATSWTTKRRWRVAGGWAHHLIDPRTGLPAQSGVIGVTVIAPRAVEADVFAKCALILGPEVGLAFLESEAVHGLLVLADGSLKQTSGWHAD